MPGLHISRKDRKHIFAIMFLSYLGMASLPAHCNGSSIYLSKEIFAIDIVTALKLSLKHGHKDVL